MSHERVSLAPAPRPPSPRLPTSGCLVFQRLFLSFLLSFLESTLPCGSFILQPVSLPTSTSIYGCRVSAGGTHPPGILRLWYPVAPCLSLGLALHTCCRLWKNCHNFFMQAIQQILESYLEAVSPRGTFSSSATTLAVVLNPNRAHPPCVAHM